MPVDAGNQLSAVSCATASLCVAVDLAGNVLSSANPASGAGAWSAQRHVDPDLISVSCAPDGVCLAGDAYGSVVIGT